MRSLALLLLVETAAFADASVPAGRAERSVVLLRHVDVDEHEACEDVLRVLRGPRDVARPNQCPRDHFTSDDGVHRVETTPTLETDRYVYSTSARLLDRVVFDGRFARFRLVGERARVEAVARRLVARGIPRHRFTVVLRGRGVHLEPAG